MASLRNLSFVRRLLARLAQILRFLSDLAERAAAETPGQHINVPHVSPPSHWLELVRQGAPQLLVPEVLGGVPEQESPTARTSIVGGSPSPLSTARREPVKDSPPAHGNAGSRQGARRLIVPTTLSVHDKHVAVARKTASPTSPVVTPSIAANADVSRTPQRTIAQVDELAQPLHESSLGQFAAKFGEPLVYRNEPEAVQAEPPRPPFVSANGSRQSAAHPPIPERPVGPLHSIREPSDSSEALSRTSISSEAVTSAVWPDLPSETSPLPETDLSRPIQAQEFPPSHRSMPTNSSHARANPAFTQHVPSAQRIFSELDEIQEVLNPSAWQNLWPGLPPEPAPVLPDWQAILQRHLREAGLLAEQRGETNIWNA